MYISVVILVGISAIFTIGGGLNAVSVEQHDHDKMQIMITNNLQVMWTDFVQAILMIIGALVLLFISKTL